MLLSRAPEATLPFKLAAPINDDDDDDGGGVVDPDAEVCAA